MFFVRTERFLIYKAFYHTKTSKDVRLSRIKDSKSGNMVIVPMDHGVSIGPVDGLRDFSSTVSEINSGGGNAVLMQKGNLQNVDENDTSETGLIAHLNASTSMGEPNNKVLVGTVEEALKRGADAVYNPLDTKLLKQAKEVGAETVDGAWMLVYQGVKAFEIWTSKKSPEQKMREALMRNL